jgi:hypothetical protein
MRHLFLSLVMIVIAYPLPSAAQVCILSLLNNPAQDRVVTDFADVLFQKRAAMGQNLLSAIDNFESTMQFASEFEAEPKIAEALLETAINESADYLVGLVDEKIPGTSQVAAAIKAVNAEVERAAAAQASHNVGAWIRAQRTLVSNHMTGAKEGDLPTSVAIKDAILEDLCWRREDGGDHDAAIMEITAAQAKLGGVPTVETYLRALYEGWINAYFQAIGTEENKNPGTVHVVWEVDVAGSPSDYSGDRDDRYPLEWDSEDWSAEVVLPSPYSERVAGGLDELGVKPLEVRAVKKICFVTDGIAGGTATYCGGLRPDGSERFEPISPWAVQAFKSVTWREATASFRH